MAESRLEMDAMLSLFEVYEVTVDVKNTHETMALETKLWKHGFIRRIEYDYNRDAWNRPRMSRARYIVVLNKDKKHAFRAMMAANQDLKSKISYEATNYI